MTKAELKAFLAPYPDDTMVLIWNADSDTYEPITGGVYSPSDGLTLESDDIS